MWMHPASNGGVLISPLIATPAAHDIHQCEKGDLLIIPPVRGLAECRGTFLFLNKLAEDIAKGKTRMFSPEEKPRAARRGTNTTGGNRDGIVAAKGVAK